MGRILRLVSVCGCLLIAAACAPDSSGTPNPPGTPDSAPPVGTDADGDTIQDEHEGRSSNRDTDSDGTPDYLDDDSDADGILDHIEAGDTDLSTRPIDSDNDGDPNFIDTDSDNNGRTDTDDGTDDFDGDTIANYADLDDDNDTMQDSFEMGPNPAMPLDTDGDGSWNFQDLDSDNDTIADQSELAADPDMDNRMAYVDDDSDGDCILDAYEAGDADLATPPVDTDGDNRYDFLDLDSDNDGLSDHDEDADCSGTANNGESSTTNEDSDGDGVSDLVEQVAGTDPTNNLDNPQANGDFFFLVPYMEPTTPVDDTLEFATSIQFADVYFSFDTTFSMVGELDSMRTNVPNIVAQLTCENFGTVCGDDSACAAGQVCFSGTGTCIEDPIPAPGCIPDMWTGVGRFDELDSFTNLLSLQSNPAATASAIPGDGGGADEAPLQAPACVADQSNCTNNSNCAGTGVGCVGFRESAIRILIQITDADNQCSGSRCNTFTAAYTGTQLQLKGIKFVSLYGTDDDNGAGTPRSIAEAIGAAAGTINSMGQAFVYLAVDAAVVDSTVQAVLEIARGIRLEVTIGAEDLPSDDGDALQFVDYLEVNVSGTGNCTNVTPTTDTNGDSHNDAFPQLFPGTPVCWDVHPIASNTTVQATDAPQIFRAKLTVYGDGSPLDDRDVYFLIPPVIPEVPID